MTRGLVQGCLLLFFAGWLAPTPAAAMSSTRAAALWRTEAFAHTAVAQAEAGDMAAARESLAFAVEASEFITDEEDRARARGLVAWTRPRLGDAEGAFARAQLAEGKRDAARETIALARAAAEAETAPLYRALSLVRVAEALVAADDMQAALDIVSMAQAAAGAIEVPPKKG